MVMMKSIRIRVRRMVSIIGMIMRVTMTVMRKGLRLMVMVMMMNISISVRVMVMVKVIG